MGAARTEQGQAGPARGMGCQSAICMQVTAGDAALGARRSGPPLLPPGSGPGGRGPLARGAEGL